MKKILFCIVCLLGLTQAVFATVPAELIGAWQFKGTMDIFPERIIFNKDNTFTTERLFLAIYDRYGRHERVSCVVKASGSMTVDEPYEQTKFMLKGTIRSIEMLYPAPGYSLDACKCAVAELTRVPMSYWMPVTNLDTSYAPSHPMPTFDVVYDGNKRIYQKTRN